MTFGMTRREGKTDSLAGHAEVQPVTITGPGLMNARAPTPPDTSMQSAIADHLVGWGSKKLETAANAKHERDYLDGQMAYQQGKALDDASMAGNKWALEGHMFMDAQSISSSLLAAQREEIATTSKELSPDDYRARYVNRLDAMLKGTNPRTAKLVREMMTKQLPTLVADHTAQHLRFKEGKNYESLERSIDVISRDPTATDALVSFARGGEGTASAGLSDDRRQSATVDGVLRAFDNDNPLAYAALAQEGLLGDNLTTDQQNQIKSAKNSFEQRRRSEYNEALFEGENALMLQVEANEVTPSEAVEQLSLLYAEHDITMNAADAGAIYNQASASERTGNMTQATLFQEAGLRGDYDTMARITESIMVKFESNFNPNAVSSAGAKGTHQVMDATNADPGFGIRPAQDDSAEERARVGSDYWRMLSNRYKGDLEAMAIGYNAGPGTADKWLAAGRDDSVLPKPSETRPYADKIVGALNGWVAPTAQDRYALAKQKLETTRERLALDTYDKVSQEQSDIDNRYVRGELSETDWRAERRAAAQQYNQAVTAADIQHERSLSTGVENRLIAQAEADAKSVATADTKAADAAEKDGRIGNAAEAHAAVLAAKAKFDTVVDDPASTPAQIAAASVAFRAERAATLDSYGLTHAERNDRVADEAIYARMRQGIDRANKVGMENAEIAAAQAGGYLSDLPQALQSRAFKAEQAAIIKRHQTAVAKGQSSQQEAQDGITEDVNMYFAKTGTVDPAVQQRMSAAMRGKLIDKDGNPNPEVIDVVQQYMAIQQMNPRAAAKFLDPAATTLAEAVLARSNGGATIAEAVRNHGIDLSGNPAIDNVQDYMARSDVQAEITRSVAAFKESRDIGWLQAAWQADVVQMQVGDTTGSAKMRIRYDPAVEAKITDELNVEVARMQRTQPGLKPSDLVGAAMESLKRRGDIVGGDMVITKPGNDLAGAFFGGRANDFMHPGAINSAVATWIRSDAYAQQYGDNADPTLSEFMPGWLQGGIDGVASLFGGRFQPGMSMQAATETAISGIRPFRAFTAADGTSIAIQVLKPDGNYSEARVVPSDVAGRLYMEMFKPGGDTRKLNMHTGRME